MWTDYISSVSILVPLTIGIVMYRRVTSLQRVFLGFIVFSTLIELISSYKFYLGEDNFWILRIFLICDFSFFLWFFNKTTKFPRWKWIYASITIPILVLDELFIKPEYGNRTSDSIFYFVLFIFSIVQSCYVIIRAFDNFETGILNNFVFWIAFARLFYSLITLFIYIYPNFVEDGFYNEFFGDVNFAINATANIILNILYAVSFVCQKTEE